MNKKKGFTLIELLAVIVILAIIALISMPRILNVITEAKQGSFRASAYGIIKSAENGYAQAMLKGVNIEETEYMYNNHNEDMINGNITINYKGNKTEYGNLKINNKGEVEISFYQGGWCLTKGYETDEISLRSVSLKEECVLDRIAPVIVLIGEEIITLTTNDNEFNDPGATATDNIDGNITNKIEVTNNINFEEEGEYEVIYKVSDSSGNQTVVTRKIIVIKEITVVQVSAGNNFSLFLMSDGTVRSVGYNNIGQLGDGTRDNKNSPVTVLGLDNIIQVSAGKYDHSLFLTENYTVKAVGGNGNGQLGDNTTVFKSTPIDIPNLTNVKDISAGSQYSTFLLDDGTVKVVGDNTYGQLGDGTTIYKKISTLLSTVSNVKQVSTGLGNHTSFLINDGTIRMVGKNDIGQLGDNTLVDKASPITITALSNVKEVSVGARHTIFLMGDGTVKATGDNNSGALGTGNKTSQRIPYNISGLTGVKKISAGGSYTLFLMEDGTVKATGSGSSGQLGLGNNASVSVPTTIPNLTGVKQISAGLNHSLFLMEDGTVKVVGDNTYGQLGDGTNERKWLPIDIIVN